MRSTTLAGIPFGIWPLMVSVAMAQPIELPEPDEDQPPVIADKDKDKDKDEDDKKGEDEATDDEEKEEEKDKSDEEPAGDEPGDAEAKTDASEPAPARDEDAAQDVAPSVVGDVQIEPAAPPSPVEVTPSPMESEDLLGPPLPALDEVPDEAPLPPLLFPSASFFARYEHRDKYAQIGASRARWREGDAVAYRARFGLRTEALDLGDVGRVSVQFTPRRAASGAL